MSTVLDLVKASLRDVGAISVGETPSADEAQDALSVINRMLSMWSNESLMAYERVREEFALVPASASRTIGATGNYATSRPQEIESAMIEDNSVSPAAEYPMTVLNFDQWSAITLKSETAEFPRGVYYNPTFPNGTLHFSQVPTVAHNLVIYSRKPLTAFAALNTTVSLPPGWEEAIISNAALRLCPSYGKEPSAVLVQAANASKAAIEAANNIQPRYMQSDFTDRGGNFDIMRGNF